MSERLTDEDLADIDKRIGIEEIHPTECRAMVDELRSRHARDLTAEDVEAIAAAHELVRAAYHQCYEPSYGRALTVLNKLLAGGGK